MNSSDYLKYCISGQLLAREIGLKPGQMGLLVNGRVSEPLALFGTDIFQVVGPLEADAFRAVDFSPLLSYEKQRRVTPILEALKGIGFTEESMDR